MLPRPPRAHVFMEYWIKEGCWTTLCVFNALWRLLSCCYMLSLLRSLLSCESHMVASNWSPQGKQHAKCAMSYRLLNRTLYLVPSHMSLSCMLIPPNLHSSWFDNPYPMGRLNQINSSNLVLQRLLSTNIYIVSWKVKASLCSPLNRVISATNTIFFCNNSQSSLILDSIMRPKVLEIAPNKEENKLMSLNHIFTCQKVRLISF